MSAPPSGGASYDTLAEVTDVERRPTSAAETERARDTVPTGDRRAADGFTAQELAATTGGVLLATSGRAARGAAVDSRLVRPGNVFVALPGERTDGHRFIGDAVARGAAAVLVSRRPDPADLAGLGDVTVVLVADGIAALAALATAWRRRFDPLVVGVTGSIAKTSTKEAIAAVLRTRFRTLRNEGNLNNEIGLPLTVLSLGPEHEAAVLEMGMYVGGEIRELAAIGQPRIGVVTAVQPVHLSRIGTIDDIERAKGELVEALPSEADGGIAVLNVDDHRVARMRARTRARVVGYGFSATADVGAADIRSAGFDGMRFTLRLPNDRTIPAQVPALGRMAVHNALAAAAVGSAAGLGADEIVAGLTGGWSAPHRATIVRAGDVTLVDDAYNASPGSVRAALELLSGLPGRRLAVVGEMLELGSAHVEGHESVGQAAAAAGLAALVVVGAGARPVADAARLRGMPAEDVVLVDDRNEAAEALLARVRPGDVVLVKASRGVELDRLVEDVVERLTPTGEAAATTRTVER